MAKRSINYDINPDATRIKITLTREEFCFVQKAVQYYAKQSIAKTWRPEDTKVVSTYFNYAFKKVMDIVNEQAKQEKLEKLAEEERKAALDRGDIVDDGGDNA